MKFVKMSGAGNDFVLLDASVERITPKGLSALARRLCDRRWGVGADGLLIVDPSTPSRLSYLNSDGSRAFCGNGARCAAWWLYEQGRAPLGKEFAIRIDGGTIQARILGPRRVSIAMPQPHSPRLSLRLKAAGKTLTVHALNTGVPHAVVEVKNLEAFPVFEVGRALRRHKAFAPSGANVNFMTARGGRLALRTYERGVEDETLACGTGATASALIASLLGKCRSPASVSVRGGATLKIHFSREPNGGFKDVWLEGPALTVFNGRI